ncbi:MAG: holo-ACP synthase [Bacteroidetes bacterium]|nr:holo-ACP synthase [Bacteroidota bacterium]
MIAGIGTDIVEVHRIEQKVTANEYFKAHVFSQQEIDYCDKQKKPAIHYAARWAVKEAYLKAYGLKFIGNHKLHEIETLHNDDGKPYIHLKGKALEEFNAKHFQTIHVSISHTEAHAIAYVIIEIAN